MFGEINTIVYHPNSDPLAMWTSMHQHCWKYHWPGYNAILLGVQFREVPCQIFCRDDFVWLGQFIGNPIVAI